MQKGRRIILNDNVALQKENSRLALKVIRLQKENEDLQTALNVCRGTLSRYMDQERKFNNKALCHFFRDLFKCSK